MSAIIWGKIEIMGSLVAIIGALIIFYALHRSFFYFNMKLFMEWKYDALTVAASLLNVRLVLHLENVPIAHGRNVAVGLQ